VAIAQLLQLHVSPASGGFAPSRSHRGSALDPAGGLLSPRSPLLTTEANSWLRHCSYSFSLTTEACLRIFCRHKIDCMYDCTEFYVHCAIKFVHEHENFCRKTFRECERKDNGKKKERGPPGYFVQEKPRVHSYVTGGTAIPLVCYGGQWMAA